MTNEELLHRLRKRKRADGAYGHTYWDAYQMGVEDERKRAELLLHAAQTYYITGGQPSGVALNLGRVIDLYLAGPRLDAHGDRTDD